LIDRTPKDETEFTHIEISTERDNRHACPHQPMKPQRTSPMTRNVETDLRLAGRGESRPDGLRLHQLVRSEQHKETTMTIKIDSTPYERAHGRKPRGQGYWAFKIGGDPDAYWSKPAQKFDQAIQDAVKLAVCHEAITVTVMP
jgi:hypothetical protein